jgi:hypothetical protein
MTPRILYAALLALLLLAPSALPQADDSEKLGELAGGREAKSVAKEAVLFAQTEDKGFPKGKAIAMLAFFGAADVVSVLGLFASTERLKAMAGVIGTDNPMVARVVCFIAVLVCSGAVLVSVLALVGML